MLWGFAHPLGGKHCKADMRFRWTRRYAYSLGGTGEPSACAAFSVGPFVGPVAGGQTVTVGVVDHGQNTTVLFGGNQAPSVTVLGPHFLEVITPPAATPGHVDVTVVPGTIGSCTMANAYTYE